MEKVNILFVITKLELGGAQKQLLHLIRALDKKKFGVFLFTAKEGLLLDDFLSIEGLVLKRSVYLERAINPLRDLLAWWEIYRYIRKSRIDIVHTHSSKAGIVGRFAAKMAKAKWIIHTVHGWSFHDFQPALCRIFFVWLEKCAAVYSHRLVVVSKNDQQKGLCCRIGRAQQYTLIRCGIDPDEALVKEDGIREQLGVGRSDLVVSMVACLKPQKSPQDFIRLAQRIHQELPRAKFILAGDGVLRESVQKLIDRFQLNESVILAGWRRDVGKILSGADVFVLTSLWEGLPVSVLEAMAAHKPVVATDTGGIAEIIQEGRTGYLVEPRDIDQMSKKVLMLLRDEALRRSMGENAARSLGQDVTLAGMIKSTIGLYEDLVNSQTRNQR